MAESDRFTLFNPLQPFAGKDIPVEVYIPEHINIQYADAFTVQFASEEFILSFLQIQHPIALTAEAANQIESVECLCLARIALTSERFDMFLDLLTKTREQKLALDAAKQPETT